MKIFIFVLMVVCVSSGQCQNFVDKLFDDWLAHNSGVMNLTNGGTLAVGGIEFNTQCSAFITQIPCNATADTGLITNLTSWFRAAPVAYENINKYQGSVTIDLNYRDLKLYYPSMRIIGDGILMEYKGLETKPMGIYFTLTVGLDYSKGVNNCQNIITIDTPLAKNVPSVTTVAQPKATLKDQDLTVDIMTSLIDNVKNHITSQVKQHNPCSKLAYLF